MKMAKQKLTTKGTAVLAVFLCPACRAPVTVPEGGVAALQANVYVVTEEEEAGQPVPCEMCEEEERKEAEVTCDKCQKSMCRTCRRLHDKVVDPKEHHVSPLTSQVRAPVRSSSQPVQVIKCQVHKDQALCLFCQDCEVSICLVCKLTSHQPHQTRDMAAAAVRGREELTALVIDAKQQVQVMKKLLTWLSRDGKELSLQEQEAVDKVKGRYDDIMVWARRSRDELLESISAESKSAVAGLEGEEASARDTIKTLSRLVSRASSATSDDAEVLLLKNELQTELLGKEEIQKHRKESEREEHRKFLAVKGNSSAVDLELVRAFLGNPSVGGSGVSPLMSLREQIQVLDAKLREQVYARETELKSQILLLDMKLKKQTEAQATETERMDTEVAFQAIADASITIPQTAIAVLNSNLENTGNAYCKESGVFTLPVSGLYSFHATFVTKHQLKVKTQSAYSRIGLYVDDTCHATVVCHRSQENQLSINALVHGRKGQYAYLKNLSTTHSVDLTKTTYLEPTATFSAFLVKRD